MKMTMNKNTNFEDLINKAICIDAEVGLVVIPPQSINAIITDSPYGINYQSSHRKQQSKKKFDKIKNDDKLYLPVDTLWRKLKIDGVMFAFFSYKNKLIDKRVKNEIIWVKDEHTMGALDRDFGNKYESIAFMPRKSFRLNGFRYPNVWYFSRVPGAQLLHPTQKPLPLMQRIVEVATQPGDLVLDPFCGSGVTLVACKTMERRYIGFDIEQKYVDISNAWLDRVNVKRFW